MLRLHTKDAQELLRYLERRHIPIAESLPDMTPARFVLDCFTWEPGEGPADYQLELLEELPARRRVALRGPHGLGKTALASWATLHFALTRQAMAGDWKVVTTASAWRQLTHYLWPEIHKWTERLRWDRLGRGPFDERAELLTLMLKLGRGEAFAAASDKPAKVEGAHADRLLYVFDEAKTIPPATWDAAEGAFATGDPWALAISTPGEPVGRFYDIHARRPGYEDWWTRHVSLEECLRAGRVSPEWVAQRKLQWGEQSAIYQNRVLGEFASSEEDGVIPLAWVEAANARWQARWDVGALWGPLTAIGVDVARSGQDMTVLAMRHGDAIRELHSFAKADTMATAGRVAGFLRALGGRAVVDVIGLGAGVVDRLREQDLGPNAVVAFNASEGTKAKDRTGHLGFANKRAAAWWNMRELLDPAAGSTVALPPDDILTGDLTAPHWRVTSAGKYLVEKKEEIVARLGRSTDAGDAVVQAFFEDYVEPAPVFRIGRA